MPSANSSPSSKTKSAAIRQRLHAQRDSHLSIQAEDNGMTPLLPQNLVTPSLYGSDWFGQGVNPYKKARALLGDDDFIGGVHRIKTDYFNDGFRVVCDGGDAAAAKAWLEKHGPVLTRAANDTWHEWLIEDNAVAFWMRPDGNAQTLPALSILDTELCKYSNALGFENLEVKLTKNASLSDDAKNKLGKRWADAISKGSSLAIDENEGEYFKVLTRAKFGTGLAIPRIKQVFTQLSTYDLLQLADWVGAFQSKSIIRHFKKGHEIKQGDNAGKPTHFATKKQATELQKAVKNKTGPFDLVSNFDLSVVYVYLETAFFDKKKYESTLDQLELWGGPAALMRRAGNVSPNLLDMFRAEGMANRRLVGDFLEGIFNDPNFLGDNKPPGRLKVRFNPRSFLNMKLLMEWVRLGVSNGLISPPTGTEALGLDPKEEGDKLEVARKTPDRYTPVFEAKQGMAGGGTNPPGRPSAEPGTATKVPQGES